MSIILNILENSVENLDESSLDEFRRKVAENMQYFTKQLEFHQKLAEKIDARELELLKEQKDDVIRYN